MPGKLFGPGRVAERGVPSTVSDLGSEDAAGRAAHRARVQAAAEAAGR